MRLPLLVLTFFAMSAPDGKRANYRSTGEKIYGCRAFFSALKSGSWKTQNNDRWSKSFSEHDALTNCRKRNLSGERLKTRSTTTRGTGAVKPSKTIGGLLVN